MKTTGPLYGKILAGFLLGHIRLPGTREQDLLFECKVILKQVKKELGEQYVLILPEARQVAHAIFAGLLDAVCGIESDENSKTVVLLKELSIPSRVFAENMISKMTGKSHESKGTWDDRIYKVRKYVKAITTESLSGITPEQVHEAHSEMVHVVVDAVCDQ